MCVLSGANKNAVAKLNAMFRDRVKYCDLAETPVGETAITAFTVAVSLNGRHYVGVGKTKKAARNAAAERALSTAGMWTDDDEFAKAVATEELDEDPVEAVYRMQDTIFRERQMHGSDLGAQGKSQSRWNPELQGGIGRGWGGGRAAGPGWEDDRSWSGQGDPVAGEWSNQGLGVRHWDHPGHVGAFDGPLGRASAGIARGRGLGSISEPFYQDANTLNANSQGSWLDDGWNRRGQDSSGRGHSGKMFESRPVAPRPNAPNMSQSSSRFHSPMTAGPPKAPVPLFPSDAGQFSSPASTSSPWGFAVAPASRVYQPSASQNQAGLPSAAQPSAGFPPIGGNFGPGGTGPPSAFPANYGGGFAQPWSHDQSTASYGSHGHSWMYSQGSYTPY